MDRRDFMKGTVATVAALPLASQSDVKLTLSNEYVEWEFSRVGGRLATRGIRNKISGRYFPVRKSTELRLVFSAAKARVDIPWWRCTFGSEEDSTPAELEPGWRAGYHQPGFDDRAWGTCVNLTLHTRAGASGLPGKQGRPPVVFRGYGWFRAKFVLPVDARGETAVLNLGGYDQTDWNEYWIYVNGVEVGRRSAAGRWRTPGAFRLSPDSAGYRTLQFGPPGENLVAVRTFSYDRHFGGWSDDVMDRCIFDPILCDQFVTVGTPYQTVSDFEVTGMRQSKSALAVNFVNREAAVSGTMHYELDGPVRRKWVELGNTGSAKRLLLDAELDGLELEATASDGGYGYPLTVEQQLFCAIEHPSGLNSSIGKTVSLVHFPGKWLLPGETWRSYSAIAGVTPAGEVRRGFLDYLEAHTVRKKKILALYDPFGTTAFIDGMNWSLNEDQNLGVLSELEEFQKKGIRFDYYLPDMILDTTTDLKQFRLFSFPEGAGRMVRRIRELGMKFGQWFSVSGGNYSNSRYARTAPSYIPVPNAPARSTFRNGYLAGGWRWLCLASEPYFTILRDAVLHHMRQNHVELVKFDIGNYYCNATDHNHLPGKYSTEACFERLIQIARESRAVNPNLFLVWYWGAYSPFFALHGDVIFDVRLSMEACSTGDYPALFFRDAVSQALDQGASFAKWLPPMNHDSLGVWLANNWWGNYMATERWQEALVMDLARGNLLFPQIWSDLHNFEEHDVDWLARIQNLVKRNERVFLTRRHEIGDPWKDEVYGYSYFDGGGGFVFLNNMSFEARVARLRLPGVAARPVHLRLHHPVQAGLARGGNTEFRAGEAVEIQLMPFEVMVMEVQPGEAVEAGLPSREVALAPGYSYRVPVRTMPYREDLEVHFADAAKLAETGMKSRTATFEAQLPEYPRERYWIAIVNKFSQGGRPWRQNQMSQFVQAIATVDGSVVEFTRTPDFRQVSNNQWNPWIVFSAPLPKKFAGRPIQFGVSSYLPEGVRMTTDLWVIKEWWRPRMRPLPNYWM